MADVTRLTAAWRDYAAAKAHYDQHDPNTANGRKAASIASRLLTDYIRASEAFFAEPTATPPSDLVVRARAACSAWRESPTAAATVDAMAALEGAAAAPTRHERQLAARQGA
jgi:hypothetical protein